MKAFKIAVRMPLKLLRTDAQVAHCSIPRGSVRKLHWEADVLVLYSARWARRAALIIGDV